MARNVPREIELEAGVDGKVVLSQLDGVVRLAEDLGTPSISSEARTAAERIAEGRFYVACIGQFKRGKSTLLNALVGRPILPTGVTPVTSVVTVLRYGKAERLRVRFAADGWRDASPNTLSDYVSEQGNPENRKGVSGVEVFVPSPLLASGMCLVDTPGIGSVFEGNSRATHEFVPHVDAALVVLGADPPISAEELALVADVARRVPDLVFVLNKADRLSEEEREEAARFMERVLAERLGRPIPPLLEVSARERLAEEGPGRQWAALERALERLSRDAGAGLLRASVQREVGRLVGRLLSEIEERREALLRPFEESERRIAALAAGVAEAERSMADLGYLLQAEVDRLSRRLEEDAERFIEETRAPARAEIAAAIRSVPAARVRRAAGEAAREVARDRVEAWLDREQPEAERLYRDAAGRFVDLANEFLARFLRADGASLASYPGALQGETGLREHSRFYFSDFFSLPPPAPLAWFRDRLLPEARVRRSSQKVAEELLDRILSSNATRLANDLSYRISDSRRKLEIEIRRRLSAALESAASALARSRTLHAAGEADVRQELAALEALRRRCLELREEAT